MSHPENIVATRLPKSEAMFMFDTTRLLKEGCVISLKIAFQAGIEAELMRNCSATSMRKILGPVVKATGIQISDAIILVATIMLILLPSLSLSLPQGTWRLLMKKLLNEYIQPISLGEAPILAA